MLIFLLAFIVMLAFQPLLKKYFPQQAAPQEQAQPVPSQPAPTTMAANVASAAVTPASALTRQAASETETVIENDLYRITFTNRGAQVKSWILKKYDDDKGEPLDLVNNLAAEKYGYPLSLWTYDENVRNTLNSALYVASKSGTVSAPSEITFEYADGDVAVRKTFGFDHTYALRVETSVIFKGNQVAAYPAWPAA